MSDRMIFQYGYTDGIEQDEQDAAVRVYFRTGPFGGPVIVTKDGSATQYGDEAEVQQRAKAMSRTPAAETIYAAIGERSKFSSTPNSFEVLTRLTIAGCYSWSGIGYVAEGDSGRQEQGGPLVPGPWAYGYPLSHVIDNHGGTRAEQDRLRAAGLLVEVVGGETFDIAGTLYRCTLTRRGIDAWVSFQKIEQ